MFLNPYFILTYMAEINKRRLVTIVFTMIVVFLSGMCIGYLVGWEERATLLRQVLLLEDMIKTLQRLLSLHGYSQAGLFL